tara:strand:- start:803 stop:1984 length:1182 start_codon:yes stop_codon:yes gene_type:complete
MPYSFGDPVPNQVDQRYPLVATTYKTTLEAAIKANDEILICDSCYKVIIDTEKVFLSCTQPIVPLGSKYTPPDDHIHPSHIHCFDCNKNFNYCDDDSFGKCGACIKNPSLFDKFPIMVATKHTREQKVAIMTLAGQACNPNVEVPALTKLAKNTKNLKEDAKKAEETEKKVEEQRRIDSNKREKDAATKSEAAYRAAQAARGHVHPTLPTAVATHPIPYGGVAVPVRVEDMIAEAVEAAKADPPKDKTKKPRKPVSAEKKKKAAIKRIQKKYVNEKNIILEFLDMDPSREGFEKLLDYRLNRMANKIVNCIEKAMGTQMAATLNYQKKYTTEIFGDEGVGGIVDKTFDKFHDDLNNMTDDCINLAVADLEEEVIDLDSEEEAEEVAQDEEVAQ